MIVQPNSHGKCFLEPNKHWGAHPACCHGNSRMQESWEGWLPGAAALWQGNCPLDVQIGLITSCGNYLVSSDWFFKQVIPLWAEWTLWLLGQHSCVVWGQAVLGTLPCSAQAGSVYAKLSGLIRKPRKAPPMVFWHSMSDCVRRFSFYLAFLVTADACPFCCWQRTCRTAFPPCWPSLDRAEWAFGRRVVTTNSAHGELLYFDTYLSPGEVFSFLKKIMALQRWGCACQVSHEEKSPAWAAAVSMGTGGLDTLCSQFSSVAETSSRAATPVLCCSQGNHMRPCCWWGRTVGWKIKWGNMVHIGEQGHEIIQIPICNSCEVRWQLGQVHVNSKLKQNQLFWGVFFYSIWQTEGKWLNYHGHETVFFWHISAQAVVEGIWVLTWNQASVLHQPPLLISVAGCTLSNGFPANVLSVATGLRGVMVDIKSESSDIALHAVCDLQPRHLHARSSPWN